MKPPSVDVLYEDNHLLAVSKPAGLATMGVAADRPSLLVECKRYVKERYNKPGNVYLGVVSRLDAPVTGVTLLARTSKAAARLSEQFRTRSVEKVYWAIVSSRIVPPDGECVDWLVHDERHRRVHKANAATAGAQEARLLYRTVRETPLGILIEIDLLTGRKHQIRVQLAARGSPVVGDRKYGSRESFSAGIALHSRRVEFDHPTRAERVVIEAPLPASWRSMGAE